MNIEEKLNPGMIALEDEALEQVSGGREQTLRVKKEEAKLRSGPGKDYSVMRKVSRGDELIFMGEKQKDRYNKTWMRVSVYGIIGWVRADKVK